MNTTMTERVALPGAADNDRRPEPPGFLSAYPGYRSTALLDQLRATEYPYLDAAGHVYLDYAGAGLAAQAQLAAHAERMRGSCFGNPHSENPASAASSELIERARVAVLAHFNAPPEEYVAIFTPNATGACRLVGESYPFGRGVRLVLTRDNHNSVNGIREFARSRGAVTHYVPFGSHDLRVDDDDISRALTPPRRGRRGLLAYPAQSNFSGVHHPLRWIHTAHEHGYDVLLDAAAYVPSNRLDLSVVKPDFVPVLTGWLLDRLAALRHGNGEPMARIYGPVSTRDRGGTVAFNMLDPDGRVVDERAVARDTAAAMISIRTGCFCNPGAVEAAFNLTRADWRRSLRGTARTMDQHLELLGMPSGGSLRASVGLASNVGDVERLVAFMESTYRDRSIGTGGLAPRQGC